MHGSIGICFDIHEHATVKSLLQSPEEPYVSIFRSVPKFWTQQTKCYDFCYQSVRLKAWRSRKRVAQAT